MRKNVITIILTVCSILCLTACKKETFETKNNIDTTSSIEATSEYETQSVPEETSIPEYVTYQNDEDLQKQIESEEGYDPEDESKLTDDYFGPEKDDITYNNKVYFVNTDIIYSPDFMPTNAYQFLLIEVQKFLDDNGFPDTQEMTVIDGSEVKGDDYSSFSFTLDAYPDQVINITYNYGSTGFSFEWSDPDK